MKRVFIITRDKWNSMGNGCNEAAINEHNYFAMKRNEHVDGQIFSTVEEAVRYFAEHISGISAAARQMNPSWVREEMAARHFYIGHYNSINA